MIERIHLLRNVGQYDSVSANQFNLAKLSLIYAENGRGKTTLASVLRSLGNGDADIILERRRLTSQHDPHVVISDASGAINFKNNSWSRLLPQIVVFDDNFVAENICSGIVIETEHRQKLHEFILGAQGVNLNINLMYYVQSIEEHTRRIRTLGEAIPAAARGTLSVDAYCNLRARPDLTHAIEEAERALAAGRAADRIRSHESFTELRLPKFDVPAIQALLDRSLSEIEVDAAARVKAHLSKLGRKSEAWIADGMSFVATSDEQDDSASCPFCAQDFSSSPIIAHYQSYFSAEYANFKSAIGSMGQAIKQEHDEDVPATFERDVRQSIEKREFWRSFTEIMEINFDTAEVVLAWRVAKEGVLETLRSKFASPLERTQLSSKILEAIANYDLHREALKLLSGRLQQANESIALIREQIDTVSIATLEADLRGLHNLRDRFSLPVSQACQAYLDEKEAKKVTERKRDAARKELDQYRTEIFPAYEIAINGYLRKLGADFRLGNVQSVNSRWGSSCSYNVLINDVAVSVTNEDGPMFRNTLSAGDRNTLALAFFFASIDMSDNVSEKIVVIDDPMTSLDEHRNRATLNEMRKLLGRVDQLIVLSHSKSFLCPLWSDAARGTCSAMKIDRVRVGQNEDASILADWDVHSDCVSDHDHRHAIVHEFLANSSTADHRAVAAALRPILEVFMRVSYSRDFQPGQLLGPFISKCRAHVGTHREILSQSDIDELDELKDFVNDFHHDTNPAYKTVKINSQELRLYAIRTLAFASRNSRPSI